MPGQRVRLVTYAWGQEYIDRLLDLALSAALAPGNLPALTRFFDCSAVIVTEEGLFDYTRAHPVARRLAALCPLRLIALDDLVGERWQYGLSVACALFRGFEDLGPAMTDTYMLFLNADFVLADGCYERLIPRIRAGERALLSPSYCVVEEHVRPILDARRERDTGVLALPPRALAQLILEHRHDTIRAKTVNQREMHYQYMDQFYWTLDAHTLLGHQMPISLVAMRPERALDEINTFWDWGLVYEFCPSRRLTALGDSDEFLMAELRAEKTYADLVRPGWSSPREIAARTTGYITQYQVDGARFPLSLHARDLPAGVDDARASLRAVTDEILSHLPSTPIDHRNHAQWIYHQHHFQTYWAAKVTRAREELAQLESELEGERAALGARHQDGLERLAERYAPRFDALRRTVARGQRAEPATLDPIAVPAADGFTPADAAARAPRVRSSRGTAPAPPAERGALIRRVYRLAFGAFPRHRPWHPLYAPYRQLSVALTRALRDPRSRIVVVGEPDSLVARAIALRSRAGQLAHVSPSALLGDGLAQAGPDLPRVDLCLIELPIAEISRATDLVTAMLPRMRAESTVLIHGSNRELHPRSLWDAELTRLLGRMPAAGLRASGSWGGARALTLIDRAYALVRRDGARARAAWVAAAIVPLTLAGHLRERARSAASIPSPCTGVTIEVRVTASGGPSPTPTVVAPSLRRFDLAGLSTLRTSSLEQVLAELNDLQAERQALRAEAEARRAEHDDLLRRHRALEADKDQHGATIAQINQKLHAQHLGEQEVRAERDYALARRDALRVQADALAAENRALREQGRALERRNADQAAAIGRISQQLREHSLREPRLRAERADALARGDAVAAENADLQRRNQDLRAQNRELEERNTQQDATIARIHDELHDQSLGGQHLRAERDEALARGEALAARTDALAAENADLLARNRELHAQNAQHGATIAQINQKLHALSTEKDEAGERDYQLVMAQQSLRAGLTDLDPAFAPVYEACRAYTMQSVERLYALYKAVEYVVRARIPGDIVETGVWRGGGMMVVAHTLLLMGDVSRRLILFDTFEGHPRPDPDVDVDLWGNRAVDEWQRHQAQDPPAAWGKVPVDEARANMARTGYPMDHVVLVKGRLEDTAVPHAPAAVALLRLDTDWYESTRVGLSVLYPRLADHGVLIVDDYGHYRGQRQAVDEYFAAEGPAPLLNRVDYSCRLAIKPSASGGGGG
ncbi:MAG TPA: TylF/MycF/NovP-related O-methyltransferase [Candidatus Acidoferrum sp.]|nr:TylF/MycF/NovP-related O-methyltransferase [Candidatus Acidoferrum sp.]